MKRGGYGEPPRYHPRSDRSRRGFTSPAVRAAVPHFSRLPPGEALHSDRRGEAALQVRRTAGQGMP